MASKWVGAILFSIFLGCAQGPRSVTLVTINDFHGALYERPTRAEGEVAGGLPWVAGLLEEWRKETPPVLLLDGGDLFQGSWPVNASQGMAAVDAFNLLKVDASAVGNHEFDYGGIEGGHPLRGALERAGKAANWHWLTANVTEKDKRTPWGPPGFAPTAIIEKGGVKFGVIGLSTTDTPETTLKVHVADLTFHDVVPVVQRHSDQLRKQGAEIIAVVGHLSGACPKGTAATSGCKPDGEIGRLLTELPKGTIDLLITGHSHTRLAYRHDDTIVMQSGSKGRWLGRVDLKIDRQGIQWDTTRIWEPVAIHHSPSEPGCSGGEFDTSPQRIGQWTVTPHAPSLQIIKKWEAQTGNLCAPAGCTTTALERNRKGGSMLGSVVADAMHAAFPQADIAITNAGGLRANLPKGDLAREHIQGVMPFDNRIVLVEISGAKLKDLFEIGTSGAHGPLQIAGGQLTLNATATSRDFNGDGHSETWEANRLCAATIGGKPIDPERNYRVATTDFLEGGGDHLGPAFEDSTRLKTGPLLRDHLVSWFQNHGGCVAPPADGMERLIQMACQPGDPQ